MMEKYQLKKIMGSILRHKDGLPDHQIMHPLREWLLSLVLTMIILTVMVFFCIRLYQHYTNLVPGQSSNDSSKKTDVIYRSEEVETSLQNFTTRKETYEQIRQEITEIPVPLPTKIDIPSDVVSTTTPTFSPESSLDNNPVEIQPIIETPIPNPEEPLPVTEAI